MKKIIVVSVLLLTCFIIPLVKSEAAGEIIMTSTVTKPAITASFIATVDTAIPAGLIKSPSSRFSGDVKGNDDVIKTTFYNGKLISIEVKNAKSVERNFKIMLLDGITGIEIKFRTTETNPDKLLNIGTELIKKAAVVGSSFDLYNFKTKVLGRTADGYVGLLITDAINLSDMQRAYEANTVKQIAIEVNKNGKTDREKIKYISKYALKHWKYDRSAYNSYMVDPKFYSNEYLISNDKMIIHAAYGAIVVNRAVCDGMSYGIAKICKEIDIPCIVAHYTGSIGTVGHAWNVVYVDGKWSNLDVAYNIEYKDSEKFTLVGMSELAKDISVDTKTIQEAISLKYPTLATKPFQI